MTVYRNKLSYTKGIDKEVTAIVDKYGIAEIIAALARDCNERGLPGIFSRLNKIYEWLKP